MLRGVYILKCSVFQKTDFSRFSINRTCCSTDRKCDKNFGYNLPGSISARLVLDRSKLIFDWSNLIFDWSKIDQRVFLKQVFLTCSSLYSNFSKSFLLSLRSIHLKSNFCRFLPNFSQGFLSSSAGKTLLPLLFHFIYFFSCILGEILGPRQRSVPLSC